MRVKDENKKQAIMNATVELVNQIGFASSSVSKIVKLAGVSPATLYIYFENKEDLLVSTYMQIKQDLGQAVMEEFDPDLPVRDALLRVGNSLYKHISERPKLFYFAEQFSNSPYQNLVDPVELEKVFMPMIELIQFGIDQKIIKNVPFALIQAHLYSPIYALVNHNFDPDFEVSQELIDLSMGMAWDAIKL